MATGWENGNLFERIMIRDGEMVSERRPYEDDFEAIIEIFRPGLSEFQDTADKKRIRDTFNGTPASALRIMADGMQGSIVSRSIDWLKYTMPQPEFKGVDEVIAWLQACEDHMLAVYARSGFYPCLGPYFRGALSVGTPAIISEENEGTGKIECTVPHPRENYFRFDSFGVPVQYHRRFKKTLTQLQIELKQRGIKVEAMSPTTQTAIKGGLNTDIDVLQVYYRDDDPIFEGLLEGDKVSGQFGDILPARPWRTYLLEIPAKGGVKTGKVPFEAAGYWARPHAVWRYEISTDEIYARTPAWFSLHDARGEITASKTLMEAGEGYVRPSYYASEDMRGKIRRKPGSTSYAPTDKSFIKEMPNAGMKYPIGDKERDRIVANVERWFDVPFFLMVIRNLTSGGAPQAATTMIMAQGEQALLRGTNIQRVVNDALTPIDDRFFSIELNAGRLPEPPDVVLEMTDGQVDAEFIGPLLQAQKKAFAVRRYLEGKGIIDSHVETWPQDKHKIKSAQLLEKTLEAVGFDMESIVSEDEFAEIMEAIAQQEREQQALEAGSQIADAVPKLSKAVEPNSPIAAAVEGVG